MSDIAAISTTGDISPSRQTTGSQDASSLADMSRQVPGQGRVMQEMRRKVLSKDFWMKDENAKVCFNCGDTFTTFRRKHHCRTCGQIYDAKCTIQISGKAFGQENSLRICKTCESIIVGDDDSSNCSADEDPPPTSHGKSIRFSGLPLSDESLDRKRIGPGGEKPPSFVDSSSNANEMRRSKVFGAIMESAPALPRPASAKSLHSIGMRPRSSSHRQRKSRHQHIRSLGLAAEALSPFQGPATAALLKRDQPLPNFHTDAVIDPDLAPFLSDEGSTDDDQPNIAAAFHPDNGETRSQYVPSHLGPGKKNRPRRASSRSPFDMDSLGQDADNVSVTSSRPTTRRRRPTRTLSAASMLGRPDSFALASATEGRVGDALTDENLYANYLSHLRQSQASVPSDQPASVHNDPDPQPPAAELDRASLEHVKALLKQFLHDSKVPRVSRWIEVLLPILLRCAEEIDPHIQRGDDIDIRHYVKLKKAPSGRLADSAYISGVVFTGNVALKGMPRKTPQARLLILSFPLIYARHKQHFMSLDPVIAQEREYLRNLARRITNLKPSVVLVQHQVAGLALEFLHKAGIVVVTNVKETVLQAISRCTQTKIIASVDKLNMDPSLLGHCDMLEFKTFVNDGIKKTYAYVSGCQRDLGCTIVLRGAALSVLRNVKWITEFMCLAVYNLKLETCLGRDQFMSTPRYILSAESVDPRKDQQIDLSDIVQQKVATPRVDHSLETQDISQSENEHRSPDKSSPDGAAQLSSSGFGGKDSAHIVDHSPLEYEKLLTKVRTRILSTSSSVKLAEPYLLLRGLASEIEMTSFRQSMAAVKHATSEETSDSLDKFELVQPEMIRSVTEHKPRHVRESLLAIRQSEYDKSLARFASIQRRWETYLAGTVDPLSPLSHQQIVVLFSIISAPSGNACEGPDLLGMAFYQEQDLGNGLEPDVPLGEYIERLCDQAQSPCSMGRCDRKMLNHYRQYVHGDGQVNVAVKQYPAKLSGLENIMLMWSECRECGQETPVIHMSSNTWKFSFAKYLELTFWSSPLEPRAGLCPHDIHKLHTRYFGFNNVAVTVQYEPIRILEVIMPPSSISWKVDKDVMLKNEEFDRICDRVRRFLRSVSARIECINPGSVKPEFLEACKLELESLRKRVTDDTDHMLKKLEEKYSKSAFYEIVPLNRAVRALQEKVAGWDRTFADFEQKFLPSEKDIRKLAAQQLKHVYLQPEESSNANIPREDNKGGLLPVEATSPPERILESAFTEEPTSGVGSPQSQPIAGQDLDAREPSQIGDASAAYGSVEHVSTDVQHLDLAIRAEAVVSGSSLVLTDPQVKKTPEQSISHSREVSDAGHPSITTDDSAVEDHQITGHRSDLHSSPPPLLRSHTQPVSSTQERPMADSKPDPYIQKSDSKPLRQGVPVHAKTTFASRLKVKEAGQATKITASALKTGKSALQSMIPRSTPKRKADSKVFALARHFEQMSREFERERLRDRRQRAARVRQAQVYSMASYQPKVQIFEDAAEAVQEPEQEDDHDNDASNVCPNSALADETVEGDALDTGSVSVEGSSDMTMSLPSKFTQSETPTDDETALSDTGRTLDNEIDDIDEKLEMDDIPSAGQLDFGDIPKHDKTSIMKMLTSFWSERSASGWTALDYPLGPTDHIFADSDVIVREDEPSSLIAFSLASQDYQTKIRKFREKVNVQTAAEPIQNAADVERNLLGDTATHMRYQFQAGPARMQCKIFYAESFDAIRRACGVSHRFVESLSRCLKWDSRGGRTKSIFLKTLDDRFVIKSLSKIETEAFMRFAPDYFDYMSKCLFHNLPSALAKMLGFYQVIIKNTTTGVDFSFFFQVMENIFYEGPSNRMFDLKGSMRNRKLQITGEKDEVLLDENLLDYISQAPVYVRNHSYSFLASSISNDTLFCSKQNVMDYSLIVGLYDARQELMVGIIDYIRTYTWDKKLESWIKDRGKNKPTVRSPKEYRNRFRASISRYFPLAPSCWQLAKPERFEQAPVSWWDTLGVGASREVLDVDVKNSLEEGKDVDDRNET